MLRVEERLAGGEAEFVRMRREVGVEVLLVPPVGAEEGVALHRLRPDRTVGLVEELLPHARPVVRIADGKGTLLRLVLVGAAVPGPALHVVIAEHPELRHRPAVPRLAVREDLEPAVRRPLQLRVESVVGDVAGNHHAIDALVVEVRQRRKEGVLVARILQMDVAQNAERHIRPPAARRRAGKQTAALQRAEGRRPSDEPTT